jgi:hypothetical protein
MAVHHIHMQHLNPRRFHTAHVFTQTREIGGENGWQNLQHEVLKKIHLLAGSGNGGRQPLFAASSRHSFDGNTRRYF